MMEMHDSSNCFIFCLRSQKNASLVIYFSFAVEVHGLFTSCSTSSFVSDKNLYRI